MKYHGDHPIMMGLKPTNMVPIDTPPRDPNSADRIVNHTTGLHH